MEMSNEINALALALSKAQGMMKNAKKSEENPHFKKSYAGLSDVFDACREALSKNELSVTQLASQTHNVVSLTTLLLHSSGQWVKSVLEVPMEKPNAHGIGSAITYARRFALQAIIGIAAEEDDDGNAAVAHQPIHTQHPPQRTVSQPPKVQSGVSHGPSEAQTKRLWAIANQANLSHQDVHNFILTRYKLDSTSKLNRLQYDELCAEMQKMIDQNNAAPPADLFEGQQSHL